MIELKRPEEIALMRRAGAMVGLVLERLRVYVRPGMTTQELDAEAMRWLKQLGGEPAFKGYRGFPAALCASVNDEVVHGIPGSKIVREGDIIGLDFGARVEGFYADGAITVPVGRASPEAERLMRVTRESLERGIAAIRIGERLSNISVAVQQHAEAAGYSVVRQFVGHGIGRNIHEDPPVPNYGEPDRGPRLKVGMVLAIEPMVNVGGPDVDVLDDGWTVVTRDRQWSAHFEHTVAITEQGPHVLTLP